MTQAIKVFNINMRGGDSGNAEMAANEWLAKNPNVRVVSFTSWSGFPPGWDDYHTKVEMVIEFEGDTPDAK